MNLTSRIGLFRKYLEDAGLDDKSYQVDGVEWCLRNELLLFDDDNNNNLDKDTNTIRGGIIADEMGLGKTITMIGVCVANVMRKTLIILPVILLEQWAEQIYKTTGHKPIVYHGYRKKKIDLSMLEKSVIVLTTYQTLVTRKNKNGEKPNLLHSIHWNRLIFDEAHHLRNAKTKMFSGCYALKSKIRWLMTGTPIQNKEKDLSSLYLMLRINIYSNTEDIKNRFILRRTKLDAGIPLPALNYHLEKVKWSNMNEMNLSKSLHSNFGFTKMNHGEKKIEFDKKEEEEETDLELSSISNAFSKGRGAMLRLMTASKQSCILPKLLKPALDHFVLNGEIDTYEREMVSCSSKMDAVVFEIMNKRENKNGKLVFCHYHLEMLYLYQRLVDGGLKVIIYGKMPKNIGYLGPSICKSNLNELDYDVVIIQIQTGCEGLNLQKYNEVYFVSPHWNPMIEEQAIARCHRIGQLKPVTVSHFVMDGFDNNKSLDDYILDTQERKRDLIRVYF